jgi:hypothetical protein
MPHAPADGKQSAKVCDRHAGWVHDSRIYSAQVNHACIHETIYPSVHPSRSALFE